MTRSRTEFPKSVRIAAFQRASGHCERCTAFLLSGKFQYDHVVADALGGEATLDNCLCVCTACHSLKTTGHDVPVIAKMKRQRAKHIGAKPASRHSLSHPTLRRKLDGTVVPR